jgi:hypothetical protein
MMKVKSFGALAVTLALLAETLCKPPLLKLSATGFKTLRVSTHYFSNFSIFIHFACFACVVRASISFVGFGDHCSPPSGTGLTAVPQSGTPTVKAPPGKTVGLVD